MSRISWIVAAVAGLSLPAASAQEFAGAPCPCQGAAGSVVHGSVVDGPVVGGPIVGGPIAGTVDGAIVDGAGLARPAHHYSYYIDFPAPARTYVPYGPTDVFSFRGQAYGHAYDRWTWPAMSNASPGVGRYYQILR
ncbi:hypothetical protein [Paludisphaera sp.]|uniref:hypothetical protein n=1 Tax=Paludisphaera sp. TaxID=2017432 RepID=UPI00301D7CD5